MPNSAFAGLIAAIVAGGLLLGWHAEKVVALFGSSRAAPTAPRPPYDFNIDTTVLDGPSEPAPSPALLRLIARQQAGPCAMPPPGDDAEILLFGVYEGQGVSTASVAGMDRRTGLIDVEIEPGVTPLYLVTSSFEPMIWRFSGATQRVKRVVLSTQGRSAAGRPYAGATGLAPDQVGYATGVGCMGAFSELGSIGERQAVESVKRYTGRTPTIIGAHYTLAALRLPSGQGSDPGRGSAGRFAPKTIELRPSPVAAVNPKQVISAQAVETYDVLPGRAGLDQLVADGALQREGSNGFKIVKPITRYPADLNGGRAVVFWLGEGVPRPAGSPGHSCVYAPGQTRGHGSIC